MGQPKLLLPWGITTIVGYIIVQWRARGAQQISPVCRPEDEPLIAEFSRLGLLRFAQEHPISIHNFLKFPLSAFQEIFSF